MEPPAAESAKAPTLAQEWLVIALVSICIIILTTLDFHDNPEGRHSIYAIAAMLVGAFGHAMWLSMDRYRRGRAGGGWRYAAILFGPLTVWTYFVLEYRARAIWLIPLSIAVYATDSLLPIFIATLLG